MELKPTQVFQVINIFIVLLALMFGYQNCAGHIQAQRETKVAESAVENWELLVTSESGELIFENQSVNLTVNSAKTLKGATCTWLHERKGQSTSFETKDCNLNLEAVTRDDEGFYSARVTSADGDSILLGPVMVMIIPGEASFPAVSNVLPEYNMVLGETASIMATVSEDAKAKGDCAVEWRNLEQNKKMGCGAMLTFEKVSPQDFGDYEVRFESGNKLYVQYFTVQNKEGRAPSSVQLDCGHSIGRAADLMTELRASVPEAYAGEFGDFRWTIPQYSRETADRLCFLADPNFVAADSLKAQLVDFGKSGLPVANIRRFDPVQRKWASVCSTTDFNSGSCKSEWVIQSLNCCKIP